MLNIRQQTLHALFSTSADSENEAQKAAAESAKRQKLDIVLGFHAPDGKPVLCKHCENTHFEHVATTLDAYGIQNIHEEVVCTKCKTRAAFWTGGTYEW